MSLINQLRAHIGGSTKAAVELAVKNPGEYLPFAEKLISAKNRSNNAALERARLKFARDGLTELQLGGLNELLKTPARSKGVSNLKFVLEGRHQKHLIAQLRVDALMLKLNKYTKLESTLITAREGLRSSQETNRASDSPSAGSAVVGQPESSRARELANYMNWKF